MNSITLQLLRFYIEQRPNLQTIKHLYYYGKAFGYAKMLDFCDKKNGGLENKIEENSKRPPRFVWERNDGIKVYIELDEFLRLSPDRQIKYKRLDR